MNKQITTLLIISILLLSSCSMADSGAEVLNESNQKTADSRLEQIIDAINKKDKDALKFQFSENALNEIEDFESSANSLFNIFQSDIDSWEMLNGGPVVFRSVNHEDKQIKLDSFYYVYCNENKYFFLIIDYPLDTNSTDNVGLYLLLVVKAEDESKIYDNSQNILYDEVGEKINRVGIYIPFTID